MKKYNVIFSRSYEIDDTNLIDLTPEKAEEIARSIFEDEMNEGFLDASSDNFSSKTELIIPTKLK
jgi:hypothetical protein